MIGSLRGTLLDREVAGAVSIEVAGTGLGYRVVMGPSDAFALGDVGDEVFVWIHHQIREDTQCLYGFRDRSRRSTFEVLLGAHRVGPALALAILSVHEPDELARIVTDGDIAGLCLVPGVGKKTAERLLVELQSRFDAPTTGASTGAGAMAGGSAVLTDVHAALEGLGYRGEEITSVLRAPEVRDAPDAEGALRIALRLLGKQR